MPLWYCPPPKVVDMAKPSKIETMPPDVREWLERALIDSGFSGYKELEALVKSRGFDISHAAIHRHGQKLERRLAAIKASTEAAQLIAKAAPDSADDRSAAVISMIQTSLFDALMDLQEAELMPADEKIPILAKAAQGFAKLAQSSLLQKQRADEVRARLDAMEAAARKETGEKKRWTLEILRDIRQNVYGV